jgi:hypothetical protein
MAKCYAGPDKNLYLRGKIFYYMIELPRENGKRRYYIKSLHTDNYYEAREKVKDMANNVDKTQINKTFARLRLLLRQLTFEQNSRPIDLKAMCSSNSATTKVYGDINVVNELLKIHDTLNEIKAAMLTPEQKQNLNLLNQIAPKLEILVDNTLNPTVSVKANETYTIGDIMNSMFKKANNTKMVDLKKRKLLEKMIGWVDLKTTDKYSKFYTADVIQTICEEVKKLDITGSVKRNYTREITNLIKFANVLDPDLYKTNLISLIPEFDKTKNSERKPHWPFTESELKQIFSTENDYFKSNPDVFWTTLIGLFIGSRCNAAITLQYGDIINIDGIYGINFQNNDEIKQLKNDASIRKVPIPQQLLDIGFVDWVNRQKQKLNATDKDFIFPKCKTKSGEYNNKYSTRGFIKYIKDIGITKANPNKRLDFHSLRKNANKRYEKLGVPGTTINDIIGWEGKDTREKDYSQNELEELKPYTDKMNYDFLNDEFAYWKKVMKDL